MDLLTNAQREALYLVFGDVGETFFKTPVVYERKGDSLDRFQEDRGDQASTTYNLNCLAEYDVDEKSKIMQLKKDGQLKEAEIMLTANLRALKVLGLVDSGNLFIGREEFDYFTANGVRYRLTLATYDGPLTQENVLILLFGTTKERVT